MDDKQINDVGTGQDAVQVQSQGDSQNPNPDVCNQGPELAQPIPGPVTPPWLKKRRPEPKPQPVREPKPVREPAGYGRAIVGILTAIGRAITTIVMLPVRIIDGVLSLAHSLYTWIIVAFIYAAVIYIAYQTHHAFYITFDGHRVPLPFASFFWKYMSRW